MLVAELDAHAFDELIDSAGVSARKEAVNTLLSLGFPYALNVDPGDLAYARQRQSREQDRDAPEQAAEVGPTEYQKKLKRTRSLAFALASLGSLVLALYSAYRVLNGSPVAGLAGLVQVLLAAGSTAYLSRVNPPLHEQAVPVVGVVFAALLALVLLPSAGWAAGLAAAGSVAALIALIGWQYDDPNREDGLMPPSSRRHRNPFDHG